VLEPSSAPEHPAQGPARGPHTAAASPFSGGFSESTAPQDPQKAELNEAEEALQYSALSNDDMMDQALSLNSSAHGLPPAYGNQEQAHPTSARPSDPFPYSAVGRTQHQRWDHEGERMRSPDDGYVSHNSELEDTDSHTPVNTIQALLPPGSRKRKAALSCCLIIIVLAIVLGVVFGVNKNNMSTNTDDDTFPHGPEPTTTSALGNGTTQGSTSTIGHASVSPTSTPASMLDGFLTTPGLGETTTTTSVAIAITPRITTTTTTIETTTTTTTEAPPTPTPTTESCKAECIKSQYPCTNGCVLSGDICMEKYLNFPEAPSAQEM
ncbi:hypothetical protein BGZ68_000700, partial [Mortierella alpina]